MSETVRSEASAGSPFDAAIEIVLGLPDEVFETVRTILDDVSPPLKRSDIVDRLAAVTDLDKSAAAEIVGAAGGIASALFEAEGRSSENELELATQIISRATVGGDTERAAQRLATLASGRGIRISIKANGLQFRHKYLLRSSDIVSDLRPIFAGVDDADPAAFLIWHTLRLRYTDGISDTEQQRKTIEIAMDGRDLQLLKAEVERAIIKHKALRTKLADFAAVHYALGDLQGESDE